MAEAGGGDADLNLVVAQRDRGVAPLRNRRALLERRVRLELCTVAVV